MRTSFPKSTLLATLFALINLALASPASAQTVILQPGPGLNDGTDEGGPSGGKDTWIYRGQPTTNRGTENGAVGYGPSDCNDADAKAYVKFDVSTLPAAVTQVFLGITHPAQGTCYSNCDLNFYGNVVTQPWNEMTLTWQNAPMEGAVAFGPVNKVAPSSQVKVEYDITSTYAGWKSGTLPNHGLVFQGDPAVYGCNNACTGFVLFTSDDATVASRPYLRVVLAAAPPPEGIPALGSTGLVLLAAAFGVAGTFALSRMRLH
jgi:hypothetical protein